MEYVLMLFLMALAGAVVLGLIYFFVLMANIVAGFFRWKRGLFISLLIAGVSGGYVF